MAHLIDDPLPDHIIIEQIDNLNRKLIDTKEQTIIYETLYKSSKDGEYWIWLSNKSDGPAEINYINNFKTIHRIIYFNKGHVHRLDGPAYISYLHDGKICYQSYFIDNISYNDELQFLVAIENFKNKEENYFE